MLTLLSFKNECSDYVQDLNLPYFSEKSIYRCHFHFFVLVHADAALCWFKRMNVECEKRRGSWITCFAFITRDLYLYNRQIFVRAKVIIIWMRKFHCRLLFCCKQIKCEGANHEESNNRDINLRGTTYCWNR